MGNSESAPADASVRVSAALRSKFSKYDRTELSVLDSLFRELASRSPGPTVDKATFLKFFELPGMLGERLFQVHHDCPLSLSFFLRLTSPSSESASPGCIVFGYGPNGARTQRV